MRTMSQQLARLPRSKFHRKDFFSASALFHTTALVRVPWCPADITLPARVVLAPSAPIALLPPHFPFLFIC